MQLKNGCMAVKLLDFIGLCGEVPVSLVNAPRDIMTIIGVW